jgi:predicted RNA-binding Zn ribbon-like protein
MLELDTAVDSFEFSGGYLCLDFVNTLSDRLTIEVDLLNTYTDLLSWCREAKILNTEEIAQLQTLAEVQPREAAEWLTVSKQARELMHRIFNALASGVTVEEGELQAFNRLLSEAMAHSCLVVEEDGFVWGWESDGSRLDRPLWSIVRSAADLLTSPERSLIRACASDDCGWLFLDTSKNHTRRWCAMKSCGNRAKARRHSRRKREAAAE